MKISRPFGSRLELQNIIPLALSGVQILLAIIVLGLSSSLRSNSTQDHISDLVGSVNDYSSITTSSDRLNLELHNLHKHRLDPPLARPRLYRSHPADTSPLDSDHPRLRLAGDDLLACHRRGVWKLVFRQRASFLWFRHSGRMLWIRTHFVLWLGCHGYLGKRRALLWREKAEKSWIWARILLATTHGTELYVIIYHDCFPRIQYCDLVLR